jgi:hypothetical protein
VIGPWLDRIGGFGMNVENLSAYSWHLSRRRRMAGEGRTATVA